MNEQTRLNTSVNMDEPTDLSRRDFLKGAVGVTLAIAAVSAGLSLPGAGEALGTAPQRAYAATSLADGRYKVNANLYISKRFVLIKKDAYFTNPTDPNDTKGKKIPDSPNTSLNASMVVSGGKATVTVPLVNECFMLLSAKDGGGASVKGTKTKKATYKDTKGKELTRITEITFALANNGGSYALGACREYAAFENPPFPMSMLVPGYLKWPATLAVDFSKAVKA